MSGPWRHNSNFGSSYGVLTAEVVSWGQVAVSPQLVSWRAARSLASPLGVARQKLQVSAGALNLGVGAVDDSQMSPNAGVSLVRLLRIAVGTALFAAVFIVLGSSGAFAASNSTSVSTAHHDPDKGKGLLSGILNPVANIVDETLAQVPVVRDVTGNNTVGQIVAPVAAVTDKVEATVSAVPVVGDVVAPVRDVTNTVIPPVVDVVGSVTAPVLGVVDQATAPVDEVASPVLDPITGAVAPIVDGVTGGVADVVENVVVPVVPGTPGPPSVPVIPGTPGTPGNPETPGGIETPLTPGPGTVLPGLPGGDGGSVTLPGGDGSVTVISGAGATAHDVAAATKAMDDRAEGTVAATSSGSLARYLSAGLMAPTSTTGGVTAHPGTAAPSGGYPMGSCTADSGSAALGPCAPAVATAPAAPSASGMSAGGAGGSGGSAGPAAAHHDFLNYFSFADGAAALTNADWPLPASMPSNPGSTPG